MDTTRLTKKDWVDLDTEKILCSKLEELMDSFYFCNYVKSIKWDMSSYAMKMCYINNTLSGEELKTYCDEYMNTFRRQAV